MKNLLWNWCCFNWDYNIFLLVKSGDTEECRYQTEFRQMSEYCHKMAFLLLIKGRKQS